MPSDPLAGAPWELCSTDPGAADTPAGLEGLGRQWLPALVPGTVAGAHRHAGQGYSGDLASRIDERDWWYRCRFTSGEEGEWILELDGLATITDAWLNGRMLLHTENMFVAHHVRAGRLETDNELVLRFHALRPLLDQRRPRGRWKAMAASHQNLRWVRTTLLGRQPGWVDIPAPVGPWRGVRLVSANELRLTRRLLQTSLEGDSGIVVASLEIRGVHGPAESARLLVGDASAELEVSYLVADDAPGDGEGCIGATGRVVVTEAERWWPHTHGEQPLVAASLELGGNRFDLGSVGFRTLRLDRQDGGFEVLVNDVPVFCRGGCWYPLDPVNIATTEEDLRATLDLVRDANMNMVRIPGGTLYEDERFWDICDELGIMVWQDCMLGYFDPPDDAAFVNEVEAELEQVLERLARHPALTVLCGGQQIEEQAAFFGLPRGSWSFRVTDEVVPSLAARLLPDIPYVSSNPTGGSQPSQPDVGVSHYFGIGAYLRDLDDARRCGARFVSEGLAFAVPPEPVTVEEACGGAARAGHHPSWKSAVHRDAGRSWDTEDLRDVYVGKLFDVDTRRLRYHDPERALDLGRATLAEIMRHVMTEWRSPATSCAGGLGMAVRDLVPGAGWGVVDALGRPKAPWFSLRRTFAPIAILVTDEGLNGLRLYVVNDLESEFHGRVRVDLFVDGQTPVESAHVEVSVEGRGSRSIESAAMFEGFRDLSYAYRFGPPPYDVVVASLTDPDGDLLSQVVHLPDGQSRLREPDLGLTACARPGAGGAWSLEVTTLRFAQWVSVDVPGFRADDSWFHLPPGTGRALTLRPEGSPGRAPSGYVRALNAQRPVRVLVEHREAAP